MKSITYSLYSSKNTVFTASEIAILIGETNMDNLKSKINRLVKNGTLISLRKGLYAKGDDFNILEAVNKIFTPSYISLETVLQKNGVTFQDYSRTIFVISYQTRSVKLGEFTIEFRKIKDNILNNQAGVVNDDGYAIATTERAFLDRIYLSGNYHFDNLGQIDWEKAGELVKIYNSKIMERRLKEYASDYHSQFDNE